MIRPLIMGVTFGLSTLTSSACFAQDAQNADGAEPFYCFTRSDAVYPNTTTTLKNNCKEKLVAVLALSDWANGDIYPDGRRASNRTVLWEFSPGEEFQHAEGASLLLLCRMGTGIVFNGTRRGWYQCVRGKVGHLVRGKKTIVHSVEADEGETHQPMDDEEEASDKIFVVCRGIKDNYYSTVYLSGISETKFIPRSNRTRGSDWHRQSERYWSEVRTGWINFLDTVYGKKNRGIECVKVGDRKSALGYLNRQRQNHSGQIDETDWRF